MKDEGDSSEAQPALSRCARLHAVTLLPRLADTIHEKLLATLSAFVATTCNTTTSVVAMATNQPPQSTAGMAALDTAASIPTFWTSKFTILGKKRARAASTSDREEPEEEGNGINLLGRIIWNQSAVSPTFIIPSAKLARLPQLLEAVNKQVPALLTVNTLSGLQLSSRYAIVLQEIGNKKRRHNKFMGITTEDRGEYNDCYTRSISDNESHGGSKMLRFEIHVLPEENDDGRKAADLEADIRKTGSLEENAGWLARKYRQISGDIKDINMEAIEGADGGTECSATSDWFPARPMDRSEKNVEKRARKALRKRARLIEDDDAPQEGADGNA